MDSQKYWKKCDKNQGIKENNQREQKIGRIGGGRAVEINRIGPTGG